jgi:hypothetical protein
MAWDDAMRVSAETQQLIDEVNGPVGGTVGGMGWDEGANEYAILELLWDHGLELNDDGYAVLIEDEDEDGTTHLFAAKMMTAMSPRKSLRGAPLVIPTGCSCGCPPRRTRLWTGTTTTAGTAASARCAPAGYRSEVSRG